MSLKLKKEEPRGVDLDSLNNEQKKAVLRIIVWVNYNTEFGKIMLLINSARENAFRAVNKELITLYWQLSSQELSSLLRDTDSVIIQYNHIQRKIFKTAESRILRHITVPELSGISK